MSPVEVRTLDDLERVAAGVDAGPLILTAPGLVAPPEFVADVLARSGTRVGTAATSTPGRPGAVQVDAGRVVAVATSVHRAAGADQLAVGPLVVPAERLAAALPPIAAAVATAKSAGWAVAPFDLAVLALVRAGEPVKALDAAPYVAGRAAAGEEREALAQALRAQDVAAARWRRATRGNDGFVSTLLLRPLSRRVSPVAVRAGLTPNAVTTVSLVVGLIAAGVLAVGSRPAMVAGSALALASLVIDCVDGEVARYTRRFTSFGAWFDAITDRVKEFLLIVGLAVGAARTGADPWVLAGAALAVQSVRHASRFAFVDLVLDPAQAPRPDLRPVHEVDDPGLAPPPRRAAGAGLSALTPGEWVRRVLQAPVSERWAALILGAVLGGPLWGLVAYLALAALSLAWTTAGWLLRTARMRWTVPAGDMARIRSLRDDGVLLPKPADTAPGQRWWWVSVPAAAALEGAAAVIAAAALSPHPAAALAAAAVLLGSWRRYDVAYRATGPDREGRAGRMGPGWPLRTLLLGSAASAAFLGNDGLGASALVLVVLWSGATSLLPTVRTGRAAHRSDRRTR